MLRILLQELADDLRAHRRERRIERHERLRLRVPNSLQHQQRRLGVERELARRHLIEDDAD